MMLYQRYLLGELLRSFLSTFLMLALVVMLVMTATIVRKIDGLTLDLFAKSVPVFAANQLWVLVPMSTLVAVVLTYGRAAADNEIDGLRACGVRPISLYVPALLFGAAITFVHSTSADHVLPYLERLQQRIVNNEDMTVIVRSKLAGGEPVRLEENTVISVDRFDAQGKPLGMRIQMFDESGDLEMEILADSGRLDIDEATNKIRLTLFGFRTVVGPDMDGETFEISRPLPGDEVKMRRRDFTTAQLLAWLDRGPEAIPPYAPARLAAEAHSRLSAAFANVLFVFIGLPVAILFRKQDRMEAFLIAFLLTLFVYFPAHKLSLMLAEEQALPPRVASWAGSGLMMLVGGGLNVWAFRR